VNRNEQPRRFRHDQRNGLPRVLFMSMQRDLNRGFTKHELEIFKKQDMAEEARQQRLAQERADSASRERESNAA
jgi:hypothetical protein